MLDNLSKPTVDNKEITSQSDNAKFAETLKEDSGFERDFINTLKEDSDLKKQFADSLKEIDDFGDMDVMTSDEAQEKNAELEKGSDDINEIEESPQVLSANDNDKMIDVEGPVPEDQRTVNDKLEGKKHPETGVPFEKKTVKDADGNDFEGVFPQFDSQFDAQLSPEQYGDSDKKQFAECNKQLKEAIEKDPELAKKFTPEQLEQIKNGETPDGYTWHHNEESGKMQLVDSETHAKTAHTGGRVIWGGGQENR
jgi:hypothetical protein